MFDDVGKRQCHLALGVLLSLPDLARAYVMGDVYIEMNTLLEICDEIWISGKYTLVSRYT